MQQSHPWKPNRTPNPNPTSTFLFPPRLINVFDKEGKYADRGMGTQGGYQAAGTCVSIAFGLVGGAIVGEFKKV